ncbi:CHAP domain-containing protein [Deinococcus sp. QL22]|uniref:CHAP domain-containing protein n=1 Tax=Deinococcus sp. QL22 TaxID=2939437 RepID=UPI002016ABFD|nr:CHAP domain-containing protein [Deinococcus sp. QL22]UQN07933.1 hypothetical protein M1R55_17685 [Deinococcus sp. QL22]
MKHFQLAIPVLAALALASCNQTPLTAPEAAPNSNATSQVDIILLRQETAVVGQQIKVEVDAFDKAGRRIAVAAEDLVWESEDSTKLRIDGPGLITPLSNEAVNLRVRTANNSTYTTYLETAQSNPLSPMLSETPWLSGQAATGRNFSQLDSTWVGKTVNVQGNSCSTSTDAECGQCTAFAKAFGNQIGPTNTTGTWKLGTSVLTRGANPTLKAGVYAGDAVATFSGTSYYGHVALFNGYSASTMNVKDQNWGSYPLKISYHGISVKNRPNGVPTCNTTFSTDTSDACNFLKVTL